MAMRWSERRVENDLLKRELLLRLRAEYSGAAGRSRPSSYFRGQARRLLRGHPLFALEYRLLAIKLGVERFHARERTSTIRRDRARELLRDYALRLRHPRTYAPLDGRSQALTRTLVTFAFAMVIALLAAYDLGAFGSNRATSAAKTRLVRPIGEWAPHRLRAGRASLPPPHAVERREKRRTKPAGRPSLHVQPTAAQKPALVSYKLQTTAATAVSRGDPAPLPARPSTPPPAPLKAP